MEFKGLFSTSGECINSQGKLSGNINELIEIANSSSAPLYLAACKDTIILLTVVGVDANQKFKRDHAVIYIEEHTEQTLSISALQKLIVMFYQRCQNELLSLEYSISKVNTEINSIAKITQFPSARTSSKEILQYTLGRALVGKETTAYSKDPFISINYLLSSFDILPKYIKDSATLAITKFGFEKAKIAVTNSSDIIYQLNVDEERIVDLASANHYLKFVGIYDEINDSDVMDAFKEKILRTYDKKYAFDVESKDRYINFLKKERLHPASISLLDDMNKSDEKTKKSFIPKINFMKNKQDGEFEDRLVVKIGNQTLIRETDYAYNPENCVLLISPRCIASAEKSRFDPSTTKSNFVNSNGVNSFEKKQVSSYNSSSLSLQSSYQKRQSPSSSMATVATKKTTSPSTGTTPKTFSLPSSLFVIGVGETGLKLMYKMVSESQFIKTFDEHKCNLSLYTYADKENMDYGTHTPELEIKIESIVPQGTYTANPTPARFINAKAKMAIFVCHENDLVSCGSRLKSYVEQINGNGSSICSMFLIMETKKSETDLISSTPWLTKFNEIIQHEYDIYQNDFETKAYIDFAADFNIFSHSKINSSNNSMDVHELEDHDMMKDVRNFTLEDKHTIRLTQLKSLYTIVESFPNCTESGKYCTYYRNDVLKNLDYLCSINPELRTQINSGLQHEIQASSTVDGIFTIVNEILDDDTRYKTIYQTLKLIKLIGKKVDAISDIRLQNSLMDAVFNEDMSEEAFMHLMNELKQYGSSISKQGIEYMSDPKLIY